MADDEEEHAQKKRKAEKQAKASMEYDAGGENFYVDTAAAASATYYDAQYPQETYQQFESASTSYSAAISGHYSAEHVTEVDDTDLVMSLRGPSMTAAHFVPVLGESKVADLLAAPSAATYLRNDDSIDEDGDQ